MNDVIKFTQDELQSIAQLQSEYQQNIYTLGQIDLEKTDVQQQLEDLERKRKEVFETWKTLQNKESNLLNSLSQKYGDGTLNIKDGTFKPIQK